MILAVCPHVHPPGSHWLTQSSVVILDRWLMKCSLFLVAWSLDVHPPSLLLLRHSREPWNNSAILLLSWSLGVVAKLFVGRFASVQHTASLPWDPLPSVPGANSLTEVMYWETQAAARTYQFACRPHFPFVLPPSPLCRGNFL